MASTSTRPTSVRGLYTPPAEEWVFLPPTVSPPSPTSLPHPTHLPSPFSSDTEDTTPAMTMYAPLQLFVAEYFTTALGMPFEVGKTLLQVEYRPRSTILGTRLDIEGEILDIDEKVERDWGAEEDNLSNPEEADVYFTDRLATPSSSFIPPPAPTAPLPDASGYLPDLHPSYLLKDDISISRGNGVWGMIRRLRYTPTEGLPSLWKTQIISTVHSLATNTLQPHLHSFLLLLLSPSSNDNTESWSYLSQADIPLTANPKPLLPLSLQVFSHFLTHWLLSPMELVRTRLIVMPLSDRSTPSSIALYREIIEKEGGFQSMYFHPNLLIPTVLEHTLRPLLTLSIPLLLERQLGINPDISPMTYSLMDLSLGLTSLLVLLPIETIRRRLQLQNRTVKGGGKKLKSVVRLRERDYVGVVEGIWRIISEETGVARKKGMTVKDEGGVFAGIRQLYRGFGMAATAHMTVFGLSLVSASLGGRGFDGGWKEI